MAHKEAMEGALVREKKGAKHEEKKKKHPFKRTVVEHHSNGSHTLTHEHETDPMQNQSAAVPDLDGVHSQMEEAIGEPNPGEQEAAPQGQPGE